MAKRAVKRKKSVRTESPAVSGWRRLRFWPALIAGIILLGLGAALWQQSAEAAFSDRLLRKLPKDSSVAGVARLSQFDLDTIQQVSQSSRIHAKGTGDLLAAVRRAGIDDAALQTAFDDEFGFARTARGQVAIFTVAQARPFEELTNKLKGQLAEQKPVEYEVAGAKVQVTQGVIAGTGQTIVALRSGREFYLASTPELAVSASREQDNGFASLEQFRDVSERLAPAGDGYLFLNTAQVPDQPKLNLPLTGITLVNEREQLKLDVKVAESPEVTVKPPAIRASLLPGTDFATGSVEGADLSKYMHLLEDQRQESDLPRVLALQNGLASLDRKLGVSIENDYLSAANGGFTYSRYRNAENRAEWFASLEFDNAEAAQAKVTELVRLLRERVTVPTRSEIVRILPDGSQSREIVAEGQSPLAVTDLTIDNRPAQAMTLPSIGTVHYLVEGQRLVLGSSPDAASRMLKTIANPPAKLSQRGELAMRLKLADAPTLMTSPDSLFDWVLATRPDGGSFELGKASGELRGAVTFDEAQ